MIVFSTGTHHQPFVRLLAYARWLQRTGVDLSFQGVGRGALPGADKLPISELEGLMRAADQVIVHAAPGSIALAHRCGHRPLIVPRCPRFDEHIDDHQRRYAQTLGPAHGQVIWVPDTLRWMRQSTTAEVVCPGVEEADLVALRSLLCSR